MGGRATTVSCTAPPPTGAARPPRGPAQSITSLPTRACCGARRRTRPNRRGGGWCSTRCCSRSRWLHGYEALHAGALATPEGAIAITATTGGGKSTLLSELLARGLTLMADDVLVLEPAGTDGPPLAHPAPPLMTVPAARLAALSRALSPTPPQQLASLAGERWIAVPVHCEPLPLAAVVVLNRTPGLATELRRAGRPLAALLGSLLRFPRTRERERTRFEMAGAIAAHVPIWQLDADPSVGVETLAAVLLAELVAVRARCAVRPPSRDRHTYVCGPSSRC